MEQNQYLVDEYSKRIFKILDNEECPLYLREHYSEIYAQNFLKEFQDSDKQFLTDVEGDRRDFQISPERIDAEHLEQLVGPAAGL